MRDLIDKTKMLFEMPYLISGSTDFGLGDFTNNEKIAKFLISNPYNLIEKYKNFILAYGGTLTDGIIFLYNIREKLIDYYVRYQSENRPVLGHTVTQIGLFRRDGGGFVGITNRVFFQYLLIKYDGIVSDKSQTQDGRRFWINRMGEAIEKGFKVGLRDNNKYIIYEETKYKTLVDFSIQHDAWGNTIQHFDKVFFIIKP